MERYDLYPSSLDLTCIEATPIITSDDSQNRVRLHILTFLPYSTTMAHKPRIHFPGAFYHVMVRGNGGQDIFFSDADRSRFYLLLQEGFERYNYLIHAFCQMTNHVHLAIHKRMRGQA